MSSPENYPSTQLDENYPLGNRVSSLQDLAEMFIYHTSLAEIWEEMPNFGLFLELIWNKESNDFTIASSYNNDDCSVSKMLEVFTLRRNSPNGVVSANADDYDLDKMLEVLLAGGDNSALLSAMTETISANEGDKKVSMKLPLHRFALVPPAWAGDSFIKDQLSSVYSVALDVITIDFDNEKVVSLKHGVSFDFPDHSCENFDVEAECLTPAEASEFWVSAINNNNNKKGN